VNLPRKFHLGDFACRALLRAGSEKYLASFLR